MVNLSKKCLDFIARMSDSINELYTNPAVSPAEAAQAASELAIYEVALRGQQEAAKLQFSYTQHRESVDMAKAQAIGALAAQVGHMYAATSQATLAGMNSLAASTKTTTA